MLIPAGDGAALAVLFRKSHTSARATGPLAIANVRVLCLDSDVVHGRACASMGGERDRVRLPRTEPPGHGDVAVATGMPWVSTKRMVEIWKNTDGHP